LTAPDGVPPPHRHAATGARYSRVRRHVWRMGRMRPLWIRARRAWAEPVAKKPVRSAESRDVVDGCLFDRVDPASVDNTTSVASP
jgi:hypothetical protein